MTKAKPKRNRCLMCGEVCREDYCSRECMQELMRVMPSTRGEYPTPPDVLATLPTISDKAAKAIADAELSRSRKWPAKHFRRQVERVASIIRQVKEAARIAELIAAANEYGDDDECAGSI